MLASLYDVISCEAINVKNVREIWGTSFKFWLRPWVTYIFKLKLNYTMTYISFKRFYMEKIFKKTNSASQSS